MKTSDRSGFVYLLRARNGAVKIGRSKDPETRMKGLTMTPTPLTLLHRIATNDAPGLERYLHRKFCEKRIRGEWFSLSEADVLALQARDRIDGYRLDVQVRDAETNRPVKRHLWAEADRCDDVLLRQSLLQRRDRIRAEVASLRADLDFINARRAARGVPPIQMTFDFEETEEE